MNVMADSSSSLDNFSLITPSTIFSTVVVCDGDFPTHAAALHILRNASTLCCTDGAAAAAVAHGLMPDIIVGDGDSLPAELKKRFADRLHIESEQESNDLHKALRHLVNEGKVQPGEPVAILGATGKREDHTIGNIFRLPVMRDAFRLHPVMITDHGWFVAGKGSATFESFARQQVSIFNLDCQTLQSQGLRWSIRPFKALFEGTLNVAIADKFTIEADGNYLVYRTHEAKQAME